MRPQERQFRTGPHPKSILMKMALPKTQRPKTAFQIPPQFTEREIALKRARPGTGRAA